MLKRLVRVVLLAGFASAAHAVPLVEGTISYYAVGVNNIAVYVNAATGSPCPSGWFYSFTTDSNDATMNRLLAAILTAYTQGTTVSFYSASVVCNQGTSSRFTSLQTQ